MKIFVVRADIIAANSTAANLSRLPKMYDSSLLLFAGKNVVLCDDCICHFRRFFMDVVCTAIWKDKVFMGAKEIRP